MRNKELNSDDLQAIIYWHNKAFQDNDEDTEKYAKTLIKIQALSIYAQEEEEHANSLIRRRMR